MTTLIPLPESKRSHGTKDLPDPRPGRGVPALDPRVDRPHRGRTGVRRCHDGPDRQGLWPARELGLLALQQQGRPAGRRDRARVPELGSGRTALDRHRRAVHSRADLPRVPPRDRAGHRRAGVLADGAAAVPRDRSRCGLRPAQPLPADPRRRHRGLAVVVDRIPAGRRGHRGRRCAAACPADAGDARRRLRVTAVPVRGGPPGGPLVVGSWPRGGGASPEHEECSAPDRGTPDRHTGDEDGRLGPGSVASRCRRGRRRERIRRRHHLADHPAGRTSRELSLLALQGQGRPAGRGRRVVVPGLERAATGLASRRLRPHLAGGPARAPRGEPAPCAGQPRVPADRIPAASAEPHRPALGARHLPRRPAAGPADPRGLVQHGAAGAHVGRCRSPSAAGRRADDPVRRTLLLQPARHPVVGRRPVRGPGHGRARGCRRRRWTLPGASPQSDGPSAVFVERSLQEISFPTD